MCKNEKKELDLNKITEAISIAPSTYSKFYQITNLLSATYLFHCIVKSSH